METPEDLLHPDRVAQHADWLRRLARRMVTDLATAEDLTQDTLAIALEGTPPGGRMKGWLATILRNRMRRLARRDVLRRDAESSAARPPGEAVAEVAHHHELMGQLLELPYHYREVIVLRYFEQASHPEIARRLGIAEATVRTRLTRGLDQLRARLERNHGRGLGSWLLVAAGLGSEERVRTTAPGGSRMRPVRVLALLGAAVAAALVVQTLLLDGKPPAPLLDPASSAVARRTTVAAPAPPRPRTEARLATPMPGDVAAAALDRSGERVLAGQVVDPEGMPVPGLRVVHRGDWGEAHADADLEGRFEFRPIEWTGEVEVDGPDHVGLLGFWLPQQHPGFDLTLVAVPVRSLRGRVTDGEGAGIAEAIVSFGFREDFRPRLRRILHFNTLPTWKVLTDEGGFFTLDRAPVVEGALRAASPGFHATVQGIDAWSEDQVELVLERLPEQGTVVHGRIVDAAGHPAAGALVNYGGMTAQASPSGRFQVGPSTPQPASLVVLHRGYLPVVVELGQEAGALEVRLDAPSLRLAGRVVDAEGEPLAGISVMRIDGTPVDGIEERRGGAPFVRSEDAESLLASEPGRRVVTDAGGNFEFDGLLDRSYRLLSSDGSLEVSISRPLAPAESGAWHELVLAGSGSGPSLTGRVVDGQGQPVPGLTLQVRLAVQSSSSQDFLWSHEAVSQEDGLFRFESLRSRPGMVLTTMLHPAFVHAEQMLDPGSDEHIEMVVRRKGYLQVEVDPARPDQADGFALHDESGRRVRLELPLGRVARSTLDGQIHDGISAVYGAPVGEVVVELRAADRSLERHRVTLVAGRLTRLQL